MPAQSIEGRSNLSVALPCYNYGHYIPDTVYSVFGQRWFDVDVLVIDDASPDGSGDVAEALASSDSRVMVIRHQRNFGHILTFNRRLSTGNGDYVVAVCGRSAFCWGVE